MNAAQLRQDKKSKNRNNRSGNVYNGKRSLELMEINKEKNENSNIYAGHKEKEYLGQYDNINTLIHELKTVTESHSVTKTKPQKKKLLISYLNFKAQQINEEL